MMKTKNLRTALGLVTLSIILGIALTTSTTGNNNKTDNNFLTDIFESTHIENEYKANIIINPNVVGIYTKENNYLDLTIITQGIGGSLKENNYRLDLMPEKSFPDTADIAVTNIMLSKTVVGKGYTTQINITTTNKAFNYETFTLIIKANATIIKTQTTTLTGASSTIITFTWNTTGFARGNYTITTTAWPLPNEMNTADNTLTDGWILITKVGDLGGPVNYVPTFFKIDGKIDAYDLALFIACYKGQAGNAQYLGDLGGPVNYVPTFFKIDGKINGYDLALWIECYKGRGPDL